MCKIKFFVSVLFIFLYVNNSIIAQDNILKNGDFSQGLKYWRAHNIICTPQNHKLNIEVPSIIKSRYSHFLGQRVSLETSKRYKISFTLKSSSAGTLSSVLQIPKPPYKNCGLAQKWNIKVGENKIEHIFKATANNGEVTELIFHFSNLRGDLEMSSIVLEELNEERISVTLNPEWSIFFTNKVPKNLKTIPKEIDGLKPQYVYRPSGDINLRFLNAKAFEPDNSIAILYNKFNVPKNGFIRIAFNVDWFLKAYLNGEQIVNITGHKPLTLDGYYKEIYVNKGEHILVAEVRAGSKGWHFICGNPPKPILFKEDESWQKYQFTSPIVKENSALDLSSQIPKPAGALGRVIINEKGDLSLETQPNKPLQMLGFNGSMNLFYIPRNEEFKRQVDIFAKAARRQGYSIFRVHGSLDKFLSYNTKKDMDINPEYLDRWDYFASAFKKEGIYLNIVIFSYNLYTANSSKTFNDRMLHKTMMYLDGKWEMDRFKYAVDKIFNHVNPYTKMAWKDDPVIAFVEYYNEQEICLGHRMFEMFKTYPEAKAHLLKYWHEWWFKKYGSLPNDLKIPTSSKDKNSNDFAVFWMDRALISARNCEKIVRDTGYKGLVTNFSFSDTLGHAAVRSEVAQVVSKHGYFYHPSKWSQPGSMVGNKSSIEREAASWMRFNTIKLTGRPFIVGEYNHCFWNPYRYEAGMVVGGYSALQGYGAIQIHSGAVEIFDISNKRIDNFSVAVSPLVRANQFLSACLLQRKDVKKSPHQVSIIVPKKFLFENSNAEKAMSMRQANLGLLTGYGLVFPDFPTSKETLVTAKSDLSIMVAGTSEVFTQDWFSDIIATKNSSFSLAETTELMKKRGILSKTNISNPTKGIYQSDTEELTLYAKEKKMTILTPKTEAISMLSGKNEKLNILNIKENSANSCVAICSVDNEILTKSNRMVILYITQEANTNMELSANNTTLINLGTAPTLCRRGVLELKINRSGDFKLYALGIDGSRREELTIENSKGLNIKIDTAKLKYGPTPFFELVAETM